MKKRIKKYFKKIQNLIFIEKNYKVDVILFSLLKRKENCWDELLILLIIKNVVNSLQFRDQMALDLKIWILYGLFAAQVKINYMANSNELVELNNEILRIQISLDLMVSS